MAKVRVKEEVVVKTYHLELNEEEVRQIWRDSNSHPIHWEVEMDHGWDRYSLRCAEADIDERLEAHYKAWLERNGPDIVSMTINSTEYELDFSGSHSESIGVLGVTQVSKGCLIFSSIEYILSVFIKFLIMICF